MKKIAIISGSVREGRLSHRVALFIEKTLAKRENLSVEIIDLKEYNFPIFDERLPMMKSPSDAIKDFANRVTQSDGIIIVSPVYNSSFPSSLKNVVDLLVREWSRKPIAVVTVSAGATMGVATLMQLQGVLSRLGAIIVPTSYMSTSVGSSFNEQGDATNPEKEAKTVMAMIEQLELLMKLEN